MLTSAAALLEEPRKPRAPNVGPGDVLAGRFELGHRLGAGGLAEVYAAHDRVSGSEVALKLLHAHLSDDRDLVERFRRELSSTRALDHRGIVRVFDLHRHRGRPFISMELLRGRSLAGLLLEQGPLPAAAARRIAREICCALQAAHGAGVVHRDLKPQNIFICDDGSVKLLDFGLARVAGQARLTSATAVPGTPGYIAPELFAGQRADARTDLYALGATFFEMLTGLRPFASSDPYGAVERQEEGTPSDARLSEADAALVRRALDPDPELRFLDAAQMFRALDGEQVPRPPAAPPVLAAGEFDVLVHDIVHPLGLLKPQPIAQVLDRLGAEPRARWRWRLLGAGQAVLVSGASRRSAEATAAVCAEHGLPATVRPVSRRPPSEEWLARHGGWLLMLLGAAALAPAPAIFEVSSGWIWAAAFAGYLLSWGLRPPASQAPLVGQPRQDPGLWRLAEGVARRSQRLRKAGRRGAGESAFTDLIRDADEAAAQARSATPADTSGPPLADQLTARLLRIAAALDDALEAA